MDVQPQQQPRIRINLILITVGLMILVSGIFVGSTWDSLQKNYEHRQSDEKTKSAVYDDNVRLKEEIKPNDIESETEEIFNDFKKLNSKVFTSTGQLEPKESYATYLIRNNFSYQRPFGDSGGEIVSPFELVVIGLDTQSRKVIPVSSELTHPDLIAFIEHIPHEVAYNVYPELLRLSNRTLWGKVKIVGMADPPISIRVGYFTYNLDTGVVETFALPNKGALASVQLNPNTGDVLYESVQDGLSLYEYNLFTATDTLVVRYPQDIFEKYCSWFVSYVYHQTDFYGDCGINHSLRPDWVTGGGISYFDFVTQERIVVD